MPFRPELVRDGRFPVRGLVTQRLGRGPKCHELLKIKRGVGNQMSANGGCDAFTVLPRKGLLLGLLRTQSRTGIFFPRSVSVLHGSHSIGFLVEVELTRGTRDVLVRVVCIQEVVEHLEGNLQQSSRALLLLPGCSPFQGRCSSLKVG